MAGHRLGGAFKQNSGYDFIWVPDSPTFFDNFYYHVLYEDTYNWIQIVSSLDYWFQKFNIKACSFRMLAQMLSQSGNGGVLLHNPQK